MLSKRVVFVLCTLLVSFRNSFASRPNVIFIMVDDLGFNDIGYHAKNHNSDIRTPFLDAMASQGIKLNNYYVQPRCTPTRSQLLTGRYDIYTGLQHAVIYSGQPNSIPVSFKLLPEYLKGCDYQTHMIGKWHLGFYKEDVLPWKRGFDSFYGMMTGGGDQYTRRSCHKGICGIDLLSSKQVDPLNDTWGEYSAHLYARKAIEAIDQRDESKPFFLYLSYQSVHYPIQAPEEYVKRYSHIKDLKRRTYAGMVAALDESIQNVTTYLSQSGLMENTIIIFSTDNGGIPRQGGNNFPYRGGKATLWEGGVKAVGFIYGMSLVKKSVTHNGLLHISDWFPTIMRVANCPMPSDSKFDGFDQWEAINQKKPSERTEILHNIDPLIRLPHRSVKYANSSFDTRIRAAIRMGPWKLITGNPYDSVAHEPPEYVQKFTVGKRLRPKRIRSDAKPDVQLFHLESDPYELHDLSFTYSDVADRLLDRLAQYEEIAVPVNFPRFQKTSNPKFHGGYWRPWVK